MSVSVVVCAYTEQRWDELVRSIDSLRMQTTPPDEVILVIDHCPPLLERAIEAFDDVQVIANEGGRGVSDGRNTGIAAGSADIVAFIDEDAVATPDWVERISASFDVDDVIGTGGSIAPEWVVGRPVWFPEEFDWVVGSTYRGMPTIRTDVRNVIGCNMAVRRTALNEIGGFRAQTGRVGQSTIGREDDETDLFIRAARQIPGSRVVYDPAIRVVDHRVPAMRSSPRYFVRRCFSEGVSKARLSRHNSYAEALSVERDYVRRVLPRGFGAGLAEGLRGRPAGFARSAGIALGTVATASGFAIGFIARLR